MLLLQNYITKNFNSRAYDYDRWNLKKMIIDYGKPSYL